MMKKMWLKISLDCPFKAQTIISKPVKIKSVEFFCISLIHSRKPIPPLLRRRRKTGEVRQTGDVRQTVGVIKQKTSERQET